MRILLTATTLVLLTGCGTWSIGRGPADIDLVNDGSTEQQKKLRDSYELKYERGMIERPGGDKDEIAKEIGESVAETKTPAYSENAADYLGSSDIASDATDTAVVGFDRFAHSNVPSLGITGGCVLVGAAIGIASTVPNTTGFDAGTFSVISEGAFGGAVGGLFLAVPIEFIYSLSVPLLSSALASADYKKGVRAFNKDLELRILKAGKKPDAGAATAPPPPTTPPKKNDPDEPPPPVETPSGG
jgi:hypothetical protein